MSKNLCGKTRKVDDPYEIWVSGDWEWRVLKKYQTPEKESENPYARWHCAVKSPMTYGSWKKDHEITIYQAKQIERLLKKYKKLQRLAKLNRCIFDYFNNKYPIEMHKLLEKWDSKAKGKQNGNDRKRR